MNNIWLIILMMILASALLRFLPFIIFSNNKELPSFIMNLSKNLPLAAMGMLIIYCLIDIDIIHYYGLPELISILFIIISYIKTKSNLISIFGSTIIYLILVNIILV